MTYTDYLAHYGVLGMKWGVRRYQNKDGSLTAEGRRHVKENDQVDRTNEGDQVDHAKRAIIEDEQKKNEYIDLAAKSRVAYDKWYFNLDDGSRDRLDKEHQDADENLVRFLKESVGKKYLDSLTDYEVQELVVMELDDTLTEQLDDSIKARCVEIDPKFNTYYTDYFERTHTDSKKALAHYGILGMKWGVRRYQNPDGSLTSAGIARYKTLAAKSDKYNAKIDKINSKMNKSASKRSKLEAERLRLETKAESRRARAVGAQYKAAMGKRLNAFDRGNLRRLHRAEKRLFKINNYLNTPLSKIKKLEARDLKVQQQINKLMSSTVSVSEIRGAYQEELEKRR